MAEKAIINREKSYEAYHFIPPYSDCLELPLSKMHLKMNEKLAI